MSVDKTSDRYLKMTLISSMNAQIVAKMILYPIDTIKIKQYVTMGAIDRKKNGIITTFKNTLKNEGIKGFYKGVFTASIGASPGFGVYMTTYQYSKKKLADQFPFFKKYEGFKIFCSGMAAEIVACFLFLPIDIVKERMQVQSNLKIYNYKNGIEAIKQIVQDEGILGIYKGYGATVAYFGPWSAFYFYFYEKYKKLILQNPSKPSFLESLFTGACAGLSSSFLVNPIGVVKVRIQVQRGVKSSQSQVSSETAQLSNFGYKNFVHGMYMLVQKEGITAMYKGFVPKIFYVGPSSAITMACTEYFRQQLLDNTSF